MTANEAIVRDFIAAWSRLNADELVEFFTPDGTYHNMMAMPVSGHDDLRRFIGGFIGRWSATSWEIVNLVGHGDLVIAERVDRTRLGDKQVEAPVLRGVRDGRRQDQGVARLLRSRHLYARGRLRSQWCRVAARPRDRTRPPAHGARRAR